MKKINLLAALVAGVFATACTGGSSSSPEPTPTETPPPSEALTVSITPPNVNTGVGAVVPLQINAKANVAGVTNVVVDMSQLASDSNFNGVDPTLNCAAVAVSDTNTCYSNLSLAPNSDIASTTYNIPYSYVYNGETKSGTIPFVYDVVAGQVVDGVQINTNYIYGTTTLSFKNTSSATKVVSNVAVADSLSMLTNACNGATLAPDQSCSVTVSPNTVMSTAQLSHQLKAGVVSTVTLNYTDSTIAAYSMQIEATGYSIANVDTQNGYLRVRYQWQNPSPVGSSYNNRDLDTKTGFIGDGNFSQVANEYLGYGFYYGNIGYHGMMSGNSPEAALSDATTFLAWAGDTISGSRAGVAVEDILINFQKVNTFESSVVTIQVPLAAHWFSRSGTTDNNFNLVIDSFPAGTVFEYSSVNSSRSYETTATPSSSYNRPAYTMIVNSRGGISGDFDTFGAIRCNIVTHSCVYQ